MKFYRPASVLQLIFLAFSLVGLPLALALITATLSVDRLAAQSQQAVLEAARTVESGRMLVEEVTAMERHARQFQLLGDPSFYELYLKQREEFKQSVEILAQRDLNLAQRAGLNKLTAEEYRIYQTLHQAASNSQTTQKAVAQFPQLTELARSIFSESTQLIGRELDKMQREAARVQQLFWQALALIPAVVVLAVLSTFFIAKPIRQIDQAIRRLGEGEFSTPIEVRGPKDLEELGKQLDWLRIRLIELDEQKAKFLRHLSHELKTPLTAIREGAQLLSDQVIGTLNQAQGEIAQILCKSSLQLQKYIEDLLSFSTIAQMPTLSLNRHSVRLDRLVEKVLADQKVPLQAKNLQVKRRLVPVRIKGDGEKLRVILNNLLSNAIKYSPYGGQIGIMLSQQAGHVILEVQDEGPGIAPEERDKIFDPFYQGRAVANGPIKGTGLGLAIAEEYVKAHNGNIEVIDRKPGAHLRVILPLGEEVRQ